MPHAAKSGRSGMLLPVALSVIGLIPLACWAESHMLPVGDSSGWLQLDNGNPLEVQTRLRFGRLILSAPNDEIRYTLLPGERFWRIAEGRYKIRIEGADGLTPNPSVFTMKQEDT